MDTITLPRFSDLHCHFRQGDAREVVKYTAAYADYALAMPNTDPPLTTGQAAADYVDGLQEWAPDLQILPVLYLTDDTAPHMIAEAAEQDVVIAKLYPAHATTGAAYGVRDIRRLHDTFKQMEDLECVLCVHGEMGDDDVLTSEHRFLDTQFQWLVSHFPYLRIVLEHITTAQAVKTVSLCGPSVAATITAHHLDISFRDVVGRKLYPANFCLPIAKHDADRKALQQAATGEDPKFFLGSDSAPHTAGNKFGPECCAGCFTAPVLPSMLVETFERLDALAWLPDFASYSGADFYGLRRPTKTITLHRELHSRERLLRIGGDLYPLFRGGEQHTFQWMLD